MAGGECVPYHHVYPVKWAELFLRLVVSAATSLRGAARTLVLKFADEQRVETCAIPTWTTGRLWLLRIGYYQLTRAKEQADDWVWIVDHTVQISETKCLLVLGVRLSQLPPEGCVLTHAMLEPLELIPVKKSNGTLVYEQLTKLVEKTGIPRQIISDHGHDLHAGITLFCKDHPQVAPIHDIKHKTALVLKQALEHDVAWCAFTQQANLIKHQMQQTALAALVPPCQKSKARYMNVHELATWAQTILALLDQPALQQKWAFNPEALCAKFGWVSDYRKQLEEWRTLFDIVSVTESYVRMHGLHADSARELEAKLSGLAHTARASQISEELLAFVAQQAALARPHERLLGSSEVIESVFGKMKRLEQGQSQNGFTGLILGVCTMVGTITQDVILQALQTVSTQQVWDWCHNELGPSVQSQRRALFRAARLSEQKPGRDLSPT